VLGEMALDRRVLLRGNDLKRLLVGPVDALPLDLYSLCWSPSSNAALPARMLMPSISGEFDPAEPPFVILIEPSGMP
ncbi:hypothetical protein, partial [Stenotrophomonas indicatrix]|uniref:hypothetical protein n=1 Tax=Stenotrophomonas indicatrix TaxID=2045451 RepID=UPI001967842C